MGLFDLFKKSQKPLKNGTLKNVNPQLSKTIEAQDQQIKMVLDAEKILRTPEILTP